MIADPRSDRTIHFAVGNPDGPRSSVWRLWTSHRSDVYLAALPLVADLKVSLHQSGKSRFAFTKEHAEGRESFVPVGQDRAKHKWETPAVQPGTVVRAFRVIVAGPDVISPAGDNFDLDDIHWLPAPPPDAATHITLAYSSAADDSGDSWPGRANGTELIERVPLANGTNAWLVAITETMGAAFLNALERPRAVLREARRTAPAEVAERLPPDDRIRAALLGDGNDGVPVHIDIAVYLGDGAARCRPQTS